MAGSETIGARVSATDDDDVLARGENLDRELDGVAVAALVLLGEEFHREVNPLQFAAGNTQIAGMLCATCEHDGIEVTSQIFDRNVLSNLGIRDELHAFSGHLIETAIDNVLFQLKLWDAVTEQPANAV